MPQQAKQNGAILLDLGLIAFDHDQQQQRDQHRFQKHVAMFEREQHCLESGQNAFERLERNRDREEGKGKRSGQDGDDAEDDQQTHMSEQEWMQVLKASARSGPRSWCYLH